MKVGLIGTDWPIETSCYDERQTSQLIWSFGINVKEDLSNALPSLLFFDSSVLEFNFCFKNKCFKLHFWNTKISSWPSLLQIWFQLIQLFSKFKSSFKMFLLIVLYIYFALKYDFPISLTSVSFSLSFPLRCQTVCVSQNERSSILVVQVIFNRFSIKSGIVLQKEKFLSPPHTKKI